MNETTNISSQTDNQNPVFESAKEIKQKAVQEIKLIENLVREGAMTENQGLNLVNIITKKAFENYTKNGQPFQEQIPNETLQETVKETPDFFKRDGRIDVFDYLKNSNIDFDDDEISKISSLVEKIENSAIERFLKQQEHEKTLNSENESAKQRLRANAQNSVSDGATNLVFTREQIGKMSGAEFAKHERAIMDQLKKGLIR